MVHDVRSNAASVSTASARIAQGNADLSHRTEEQASSLQENAATMERGADVSPATAGAGRGSVRRQAPAASVGSRAA